MLNADGQKQVGGHWRCKGKWNTRVKREGYKSNSFPGGWSVLALFEVIWSVWGSCYLWCCSICSIPLVSGSAWSALVLGRGGNLPLRQLLKQNSPKSTAFPCCILAPTLEGASLCFWGHYFSRWFVEAQSPGTCVAEVSRGIKSLSERQYPFS